MLHHIKAQQLYNGIVTVKIAGNAKTIKPVQIAHISLQSPPSVRPSRYLLLNRWTKSNQMWCVICSHEWGVQPHIFFYPVPWGPGEGSNIIKFQLQSQFQRFFNQTLCVFSHMKNINHIRWDFNLAAWVMPQGWDLGGTVGGSNFFFSKFNQIRCVSYLHEWHMH